MLTSKMPESGLFNISKEFNFYMILDDSHLKSHGKTKIKV